MDPLAEGTYAERKDEPWGMVCKRRQIRMGQVGLSSPWRPHVCGLQKWANETHGGRRMGYSRCKSRWTTWDDGPSEGGGDSGVGGIKVGGEERR